MSGDRWWHALFALTMAVLAGIAVAGLAGGQTDEWQALVPVAVLTAAYAALARRGFRSQRAGVALVVVLIVCAGCAVRVDPSMGLIQCIAMPLIWTRLERTRDAVIGNIAITVVIAVAMALAIGPSPSTAVQVALIEGISLGGSIALGLWITQIAELSSERARLLDELRLAQAEVEALGREAGSTSERARWAREVHDGIAQSLTGLVMLGQRARRELASAPASAASPGAAAAAAAGRSPAPAPAMAALAETLELLEETARDTLAETRSLVAATAPADLGGGIVPALERLARRFQRETGIEVTLHAVLGRSEAAPAMSTEAEVVLLRCAQESLGNVRKHSGATRADLVLDLVGDELVLTVTDDGCGFDAAAATDGYGLAGMRERLALVDGRLDVSSRPGTGSTLTAALRLTGAPA